MVKFPQNLGFKGLAGKIFQNKDLAATFFAPMLNFWLIFAAPLRLLFGSNFGFLRLSLSLLY
jgi:hypothetical protein